MNTLSERLAELSPYRVRVKAGRAVNDPEKMVIPGIIYASRRSDTRTARILAFGWWDWHISVLWSRVNAYRAGRLIVKD